MTKYELLKSALKSMYDGNTIVGNECVVWVDTPQNSRHKLIYWQHYGRSAVRCNIGELRFVFREIANSETYEWETVEQYRRRTGKYPTWYL